MWKVSVLCFIAFWEENGTDRKWFQWPEKFETLYSCSLGCEYSIYPVHWETVKSYVHVIR